MEKKITLLEAMTGVDFIITHVSGEKIRIKNEPGEVIKPEDIKTVPDKGLPFHKKSFKFGNLFIIFKVTFPDSLKLNQVKAIEEALGPRQKAADSEMASETFMLSKFEEHHRNTHAQGGTEGDSDEENEEGSGMPGGQRVQCQQQ